MSRKGAQKTSCLNTSKDKFSVDWCFLQAELCFLCCQSLYVSGRGERLCRWAEPKWFCSPPPTPPIVMDNHVLFLLVIKKKTTTIFCISNLLSDNVKYGLLQDVFVCPSVHWTFRNTTTMEAKLNINSNKRRRALKRTDTDRIYKWTAVVNKSSAHTVLEMMNDVWPIMYFFMKVCVSLGIEIFFHFWCAHNCVCGSASVSGTKHMCELWH